MTRSSAAQVQQLSKDYAGEKALAGISLEVASGTLFGIIGADGAGKTTLMRILATLVKPDRGSAFVLGFDAARDHQAIRASIGYMPQRFSLYEDLSVRENLLFFADVFGLSRSDRDARMDRLLGFSRLGPFRNRHARNLSGGMKQKLALSCALIHTPRLLILDEPTTGVDPVSRREFWRILHDLRAEGITILVSTPYMEEAEYCDRLALLHQGALLLDAAPSEAVRDYPLHLYRASRTGESLTYAATAPVPEGLTLIYPRGGDLRIATTIPPDRGSPVADLVRSVLPEVEHLAPVAPRLEDLLFLVLSQASGSSLSVRTGSHDD